VSIGTCSTVDAAGSLGFKLPVDLFYKHT